MKKEITTTQELNGAVATLNAKVIQMCRETDPEKLCNTFVEAKDLMVSIFQHNVTRLNKNTTQN